MSTLRNRLNDLELQLITRLVSHHLSFNGNEEFDLLMSLHYRLKTEAEGRDIPNIEKPLRTSVITNVSHGYPMIRLNQRLVLWPEEQEWKDA